ncbi:MAG TPA: DegT/DnrJ/EryC1/StrS aminotransferase family protein [Spirochaetia bacterium]|nr:DegT/DnrJ/EryC1/StrS aminotransferase family protein [Spirochaetia bacterium]
MEEIKLIKSTFYKEADTKKKLINFIKSAKILSFGPECENFERNFSKYQGRDHTVFLNSGSSANLAIIQSLINLGRLQKGDLVGFSALTWSTNVMPLIELGLKAVPIDVELDTLNVSSSKLLEVLGKHSLKALFITNLLGFCDDLDKIKDVCNKKKIILIEDNCESLGTVYMGKKLGNYGVASTFSFYVGHHMSTIEGGAVCTDDLELAKMLRLVRAHGWDRNLSTSEQVEIRNLHNVNSNFYSRYTFYDLGYNLRPTEICGFIGNIQIPYINEIAQKRNKNYRRFSNRIYQFGDKYYPIKDSHIDFLSNFAVPIICRDVEIRNLLVEKCNKVVEIRPIVGGDITAQPFFIKYSKEYLNNFSNPNARLIHNQGLYFGNNPEMKQGEIKAIIDIFT